jgi:hypothetical protein
VEKIKVVFWDNIGNTLLGVRPWEKWDERTREQFLAEDPQAPEHIHGFAQIFADYEVDLVWLYDPEKYKQGFVALYDEYSSSLRAMPGIHPDSFCPV